MLIASQYPDEYSALVCALFSYGKASSIVSFLESLDFSLIDAEEEIIKKELEGKYYRFQSQTDIMNLFITLARFKKESSLEDIFIAGYMRKKSVMDGVNALIVKMHALNSYTSRGYRFLVSTPHMKKTDKGVSAYKRWHMYLRWMVRKDNLDLGLWQGVDKKDLILPLDTHTFNVARKLGLIERKTYDLESAMLITRALREFDNDDPIKYDFALYRIGQEKIAIL